MTLVTLWITSWIIVLFGGWLLGVIDRNVNKPRNLAKDLLLLTIVHFGGVVVGVSIN